MKNLAELTAAQLMSRDVVTVRDETSVRQLAELLMREEISGTVVLDRKEQPIGVVSVVDIARAAAHGEEVVGTAEPGSDFYSLTDEPWEDGDFEDFGFEDGAFDNAAFESAAFGNGEPRERQLLVRDIMTPAIYSVTEAAPVREIARQMVEQHLHRLLVLRDEKVVGIVSSTDILRAVAEQAG